MLSDRWYWNKNEKRRLRKQAPFEIQDFKMISCMEIFA